MNPEDNQKLDKILALEQENNVLLKKIRRSQKHSAIFKILYWVVIVVFAVGGFYVLKPFLSTLGSLYGIGSSDTTSGTSVFSNTDTQRLQELIKQFRQQ